MRVVLDRSRGFARAARRGADAAQPACCSSPGAADQPPAKDTPLPTLNMVVSQRDRDAAYAYYRDEVAAGRCPAPLVRKDKACGAPAAGRRRPGGSTSRCPTA